MKNKSILSLVLLMIFVLNVKSQTNQGNLLLGVSSTLSLAGTGSDIMTFGYSTSVNKSDADGFVEDDPDKTISLNFVPKIGIFVIDNLAIGLDVSLGNTSTKYRYDDDKYTMTLISTGPFIRYYIPTNKIKPYIEINSSLGLMNNKFEYGNSTWEDSEIKSMISSIGGGVGVAIPLGSHVNFDAMAGYSSLRIKETEDNDDNERYIYNTLGLKLGITVLLGSN